MTQHSERKSWWKPAALASLTLPALAINATPTTASQAHRLVGNSYVIYVSPDGGNALLISGPVHVKKAAYDANKDALAAGVLFPPAPLDFSGHWSFSGHGSIVALGSTVQGHFDSHDQRCC